jgi:riboflavin kinase/FMN adenylyltransferase
MLFQAKVIRGQGQAAQVYGVPTANLALPAESHLEAGTYAAKAIFNGDSYPAVAYISPLNVKQLEVHMFGWDGELYDQELQVEVLDKLSEPVAWQNQEQMLAKISDDLKKAQEFFGLS